MNTEMNKTIRILERLGVFLAMIEVVLCILLIFHIVQYHWFLNVILSFAILLHAIYLIVFFQTGKRVTGIMFTLLMFAYIGALFYFNL